MAGDQGKQGPKGPKGPKGAPLANLDQAREASHQAVEVAAGVLGQVAVVRAGVIDLLDREVDFQTRTTIFDKALEETTAVMKFRKLKGSQAAMMKRLEKVIEIIGSATDEMSPTAKAYLESVKEKCEELVQMAKDGKKNPAVVLLLLDSRIKDLKRHAESSQKEVEDEIAKALGLDEMGRLSASVESLHALKGRLIRFGKEAVKERAGKVKEREKKEAELAKIKPNEEPTASEKKAIDAQVEKATSALMEAEEEKLIAYIQGAAEGADDHTEATQAYEQAVHEIEGSVPARKAAALAELMEQKIAALDPKKRQELETAIAKLKLEEGDLEDTLKEAVVISMMLDSSFSEIDQYHSNGGGDEEKRKRLMAFIRSEKGQRILEAIRFFQDVNKVDPAANKMSLEDAIAYLKGQNGKSKPSNGGDTASNTAKKKKATKKASKKKARSRRGSRKGRGKGRASKKTSKKAPRNKKKTTKKPPGGGGGS